MSTNTVKTKQFSRLEQMRSINMAFSAEQYTTLNEQYTNPTPAASYVNPPSSGYPTIKYMGIGRGGHQNVVGAGSDTLIASKYHSVTDAALFQQIPFVLAPVSNDLTPPQQAGYRLRVLETYNGSNYFAYYLKVIDTTSVTLQEQVIQLTNGAITSTTNYVPIVSSLSPVPVDISNTSINISNGSHLVVQTVLPLSLTAADITGIVNACTIKYGDPSYAFISELSIVGGFDTPSITTMLGGVSNTYIEIQTAQIMAFASPLAPLQTNPTGLVLPYAISNVAPLYPAV